MNMLLRGLCLVLLWPALLSAQSLSPQPGEHRPLGQKVTIVVQPSSYISVFVDLRSNTQQARFSVTGGTGNIDLYLKRGVPHRGNSVQALLEESSFVAASPNNNEILTATRGGNPTLTAGRWWLAIVNLSPSAQTLDLQFDEITGGSAFQLTTGQSGTWYDRAKNFQGIFLEMIGGPSALMVWFTYEPDGRQAFMTAVGTIDGDRIVFPNLTKTRGGRFGAAFDPNAVIREDWGSLVFTFESCGTGYASYAPSSVASARGWSVEQLNSERLTSIAGLGCPGGPPEAAKYLHGGISGAWFDPTRDGEGWLVEVLGPNVGLVYWFSYTPDGQQAWFGGVAPIVDGSILVDEAIRPVGGRFGPDYNPAQVTLQPWGAFRMTIADCQRALVRAEAVAPFGSFANPRVQRLTNIAGTSPCAFTVGSRQIAASASAPGVAVVDGDVNDPNTALIANNNFSQAQALPNPAVVPGYVTQAPTGAAGDRFANSADPFDVYRVTIAAGQVVKLGIADHGTGVDLDLYLYAAANPANPVAASEGTGALEQIVVSQSGEYFVVVRAFAGRSNYVLTVDSGGTAQAQVPGALSSFDKVAGNELIVVWTDPGTGKEAGDRASAKSRGASLGLKWLAGAVGRPVLYAIEADAMAKAGMQPIATVEGLRLYSDPELIAAHERVRLVKALRARSDVRSVDLNAPVEPAAAPTDPGYRFQWHYPKIQLPQALDLQPNANGVRVAIIDTGIAPHPDLAASVRYDLGFDFIADLTMAVDGDGIDPDADDPGDKAQNAASSFHGTHVAGTVAALTNNGIGVAGVAPGAELVPVRVLGRGGGTAYDIAQGVRYAAGLPNDSGRTAPTALVPIINMSIQSGSTQCPQVYADAFAAARARGVIAIVSSGNYNTLASSPSTCPGAIAVSATDLVDQKAPYSNFGPLIDVAAPGGDSSADRNGDGYGDGVLSTDYDDSAGPRQPVYQFKNGTSMAAPHVAGVAALMKAAHPGLTPEQFDQALMAGALTVDIAGNGPTVRDDIYGYGLIDAVKAVTEARRLAGGAPTPALLVAQPTTLELAETLNQAQFDLINAGQGAVGAVQAVATQSWVSLTPPASGGLGRWTLTVNRAGLVPGQYRAEIVLSSATAGTARVQLGLRVGAPPVGAGKLGRLYALLIDVATGLPIAQVDTEAAGNYGFTFVDRLPGSYLLVAGSDLDNDGFICDAGESCGIYPSFALPGVIELGVENLTLAPFAVLADVPSSVPAASAALPELKSVPRAVAAPERGWRRR